MPWNVALWWQLSRLRLAIEVDCDARVVARKAESNVIAYGQLLLCVRERGRANRHPVLALTHSRSSLAKRLDALLDRRTSRRPGQLVGLATLALCIAASVAFLPAPRVQTVIRELRNNRVESRVSAAVIATRAPKTAHAVASITEVPAPLASKPRPVAGRKMTPSNARLSNLTETPVPPMSVVPSNPLGLIAPATASRVSLTSPRAVLTGGGVARSGGGGGAVRAAPSAAVGRGGFAAAAGRGGAQPVLTEITVDSARARAVRAAARAPAAPRPDTTRPPR
jgi:hypothetical protein